MEISGNLDTMPIPDILQWLANSEKTGTLELTLRSEKKEIYFKDGLIISASSNLNKDRFGVLIVKNNFVTQEQLLELLKEGKEKGKLLGKLCVEKNILSEEQVRSMLQQQAEKIIESLFHRREGKFTFIEGKLPKEELVHISVVMHQLFFASASKRNDWKRIHEKLGSLDTCLIPVSTPPAPLNTLSEFEQLVLTHCNGKKSVLEICGLLDRSDFEICITLTKLLERKWLIKREDPKEKTDTELRDKIWQASILIDQKRFLTALKLLEVLKKQFPDHANIAALYSKANAMLANDISRAFPNELLVPYLTPDFDQKKLQSLGFKSQEWFVFSQINGKTPLKNIYLIAGMKKKDIQRILYILIQAGAVKLKQNKDKNRARPEMPPPQSAPEPQRKKAPAKTRPILTSTDKLKRPAPSGQPAKAASGNTNTPELKELNRIYSKYLRSNHYQKLGIGQNSTQDDIRTAYFQLCKKYHPDRHLGNLTKQVRNRLEEIFSIVNEAYSVLSNPKHRKRYDEELWANERYGQKELDDLASLLQTSEQKIVRPKPKPKPKPKPRVVTAPEPGKSGQPVKTDKKDQAEPKDKAEQKKKTTTTSRMRKPASKKAAGWEELLQQGKELIRSKKYKQAVTELEKAAKMNNRSDEIYYALSVACLRLGKNELPKAEEHIKRALIINKENPKYFCQLARINIENGKNSEAEKFLKTALAWDSTYTRAKEMLKELRESSKKGFFRRKFGKKK